MQNSQQTDYNAFLNSQGVKGPVGATPAAGMTLPAESATSRGGDMLGGNQGLSAQPFKIEDIQFTKRTNNKIYTEYGSDDDGGTHHNDESLLGTDARDAPNQILNGDLDLVQEKTTAV